MVTHSFHYDTLLLREKQKRVIYFSSTIYFAILLHVVAGAHAWENHSVTASFRLTDMLPLFKKNSSQSMRHESISSFVPLSFLFPTY